MQVRMNQTIKRAVPGMRCGPLNSEKIDSRLSSAVAYVGKAVCPYAVTELNSDLQRSRLPASAADVAMCEGVTVWSTAMASDDELGYAYYAAGEMMPVMKQGEIWVEVGNAIVDFTAPVYVRHSNGNLTQVFYLTVQAGSAASKVYSFYLEAPNGSRTLISHTAADDVEATTATAIALLITGVTGITSTASGSVITCTADTADEKWKCVDLVVADLVITGETSPAVGTLGSFRSIMDAVRVWTLTLADTCAADKLIQVDLKNLSTGLTYSIPYIETGTTEATEATAIAALINAVTGLTSTATGAVITITADDLDVDWEISQSADAVLAETTSTNYAEWTKAEWLAYEEVDGVFFGKLKVKN